MLPQFSRATWIRTAIAAVALLVLVAAGISYPRWWPTVSGWVDSTLASRRGGQSSAEGGSGDQVRQDVEGGRHEAGHSQETALELTSQARANLGLTSEYLRPVELTTYQRTISIPAVIVPKPGRTRIVVSSPLNGIVTHVHAVTGEAVMPGDLLFEVRLTYEDLVETQTKYLGSISELEVENREVARLE